MKLFVCQRSSTLLIAILKFHPTHYLTDKSHLYRQKPAILYLRSSFDLWIWLLHYILRNVTSFYRTTIPAYIVHNDNDISYDVIIIYLPCAAFDYIHLCWSFSMIIWYLHFVLKLFVFVNNIFNRRSHIRIWIFTFLMKPM